MTKTYSIADGLYTPSNNNNNITMHMTIKTTQVMKEPKLNVSCVTMCVQHTHTLSEESSSGTDVGRMWQCLSHIGCLVILHEDIKLIFIFEAYLQMLICGTYI